MSKVMSSISSGSLKQVERLFFILQYLRHNDRVTARELADQCGTSERTIYRDMQQLENNGFYFTSHGKEGYQLIDNVIPSSNQLSEDEYLALTLSPLLSQAVNTKEHPFHAAYRKALQKMNSLIKSNPELPKVGNELGQRIRMHSSPMEESHYQITQQMLEAMTKNKTIRCQYHTMNRDELTERELDPYYLVPREGHLYVVAYCHTRNGVRVFRLTRFQQVTFTSHTFEIPADFDIDQFLANRWSISADEGETTFKVRFHSSVARYIKEEEYYVEAIIVDEEDGSILFEATVKSADEFMRWFKQYGWHAELLEPTSYRDQLKEEYEALAKMYAK